MFALARSGSDVVAIAIEAKVAEKFGDTVEEWLSKGGDNRRERVEGICKILEIDVPPGIIRYQLLHRTAAAILSRLVGSTLVRRQ